MDEQQWVAIQRKIDSLPTNHEFDLKTLMGDQWGAVQKKQSFGREFKKAIDKELLYGVKHDRLDNSPRRDIYKKT